MKFLAFIYILIYTLFRIGDLIFIYANQLNSLPFVVFVFSFIIIIVGIYVIIKQFMSSLKKREVLFYCIINIGIVIFNLVFVSFTVPIELSVAEILLVGSVLDILVCVVFAYSMIRRARRQYITVNRNLFSNEGTNKNND